MRVVDLEGFAFAHIWRPFWPLWTGIPGSRVGDSLPITLERTAEIITTGTSPEWAEPTLDRLRRIGVVFPAWIRHPLVDALVAAGVATQEEETTK